jgi:DNA processing protein
MGANVSAYAYGVDEASVRTGTSMRGSKYMPPADFKTAQLRDILADRGGAPIEAAQLDFLKAGPEESYPVYYAGDLSALSSPAVAIVGTRNVSREGAARARRLAKELAQNGVAVVSGLAKGVDTEALTSALRHGGRVAAVIGTPLDKAYPAENKRLQEEIYENHLLVSQFESGTRTFPSNFPQRNRLMAAVSDATVVIEASDSSGTLHQSAECQRLGRWLFITRAVAEDPNLNWPSKFLGYEKCVVLADVDDILSRIAQ